MNKITKQNDSNKKSLVRFIVKPPYQNCIRHVYRETLGEKGKYPNKGENSTGKWEEHILLGPLDVNPLIRDLPAKKGRTLAIQADPVIIFFRMQKPASTKRKGDAAREDKRLVLVWVGRKDLPS